MRRCRSSPRSATCRARRSCRDPRTGSAHEPVHEDPCLAVVEYKRGDADGHRRLLAGWREDRYAGQPLGWSFPGRPWRPGPHWRPWRGRGVFGVSSAASQRRPVAVRSRSCPRPPYSRCATRSRRRASTGRWRRAGRTSAACGRAPIPRLRRSAPDAGRTWCCERAGGGGTRDGGSGVVPDSRRAG